MIIKKYLLGFFIVFIGFVVVCSFKSNKHFGVQKLQSVRSVEELRKQSGTPGSVITVSGYYKPGDCPAFKVSFTKEVNEKDDGVIWFYAANDKSGKSGFWKRSNLDLIDIRETGAIGDLKQVETSKSKIVGTGDGKTKAWSFALQERVKPGTYSILYTDVNNQQKKISDVDYRDETGLLIDDNYQAAVSQPVGLVYYVTGRVEGAALGDWGNFMQTIENNAKKGDVQAKQLQSFFLNAYNSVQNKQSYKNVLIAALNVSPRECSKNYMLSATRFYTAQPNQNSVSPYGDSLFEASKIILPTTPKAGSEIKVQYTAITYSGTYKLPDGRNNTQALQTALDNIKKIIIPSVIDLNKSAGNNAIGYWIGSCFVPANRIIEGSGKNTCARLQFYYDKTNSFHTQWLKATVNNNSILKFIQPQIVTEDKKKYTDENIRVGNVSSNLALFSNKATGATAGNIIFKGLVLDGIGETVGPAYYDCYWDMDRKYQDVKMWNHSKIKKIAEPVRLSQHNISMVEVPDITIDDCSSSWALEDGAYFSTYTSWQDPSTGPFYKSIDVSIGAVKNIQIINSAFLYNGRNGTFITGGEGINVTNNFYNYDQFGCLFNRSGQPQNFPSGALAFEEHNPNQYLQNVSVINNKVYNTFFEGGHYLGKGKGIINFSHKKNIYSWDYADYYTTINLIKQGVKMGVRMVNISDSGNVIRNSPSVALSIQLDIKNAQATNNSFIADTVINSSKHAIELKNSPGSSIKDFRLYGCAWQKYYDKKVNESVYVGGSTSGNVTGIISKDVIQNKAQPVIKQFSADGKKPSIGQ